MIEEVIKAETLGFCMGVRRAMKLVETVLSGDYPRPIYTLGPLIHNRLVLDDLGKKGINSIKNPADGEGGTIILRAHGVAPSVLGEVDRKKTVLVDGTCPRVIKSQRIAAEYAVNGWHVLLVGDPRHGEIQGIAGHAGKNVRVIETEEAAATIILSGKTLVLGQTTLKNDAYLRICGKIRDGNPECPLEIGDTICPATEERQSALIALLRKVDCVIVVGGKNSANTQRLWNTAREHMTTVWHIEEASEIPEEAFRCKRIGITAGASTPDWIIEEVEKKLLTRCKEPGK